MLKPRVKRQLELTLGQFDQILSLLTASLRPRAGHFEQHTALGRTEEPYRKLNLILEATEAEVQCLIEDAALQRVSDSVQGDLVEGLLNVFSDPEAIVAMIPRDDGCDVDDRVIWHLDRLMLYIRVIVGLLPDRVWLFK